MVVLRAEEFFPGIPKYRSSRLCNSIFMARAEAQQMKQHFTIEFFLMTTFKGHLFQVVLLAPSIAQSLFIQKCESGLSVR